MQGRIHSFQSLGTVDGPGVRAVVFLQGCPLRCACCHNPDTWELGGGKTQSAEEMFERIYRLRAYFGEHGGVTLSGGEPLMQAGFAAELFTLCRAAGINCALDTSGCILNDKVEHLLDLTDIVLLDYKYTNNEDYKHYTGCEKARVDAFLDILEQKGKRTWLRQVIIPELNDNAESLRRLYAVADAHKCVEKVELLPFRKLCTEKYTALGIPFVLADTPEADEAKIKNLLAKIGR